MGGEKRKKGPLALIAVLLVAMYVVQGVLTATQTECGRGVPKLPIIESAAQLMLVGFRAVVVDVLWMQATDLQEKGRIDEAVAKYDKITKLQPDIPEVWHFLVWNIMYNLPHEVESVEDKWNLIKLGIVYADEAGKLCPGSVPGGGQLASQIGFMLWHRFDERTFQEAAYLRKKFFEWRGKTNFEASIEWHEKATHSLDFERLQEGTQEIWLRQITHTLDRWASQVFADCDHEGALTPARRAPEEWDRVAKINPGDPDHPEADLNLQFLRNARKRLEAIEKYAASKEADEAGDRKKADEDAQASVDAWQWLVDAWPSGPDQPALQKAAAWLERLRIEEKR